MKCNINKLSRNGEEACPICDKPTKQSGRLQSALEKQLFTEVLSGFCGLIKIKRNKMQAYEPVNFLIQLWV